MLNDCLWIAYLFPGLICISEKKIPLKEVFHEKEKQQKRHRAGYYKKDDSDDNSNLSCRVSLVPII
jgi:hypothetical protein